MDSVAHDVYGLDFRTGCNHPKEPGCIVRIGPNRGPKYRIVAIEDGEAWVKPLSTGTPGFARLENLRAA